MATSEVSLVNVALTVIGEGRIISLSDNVKAAREASAVYATVRDQLLGAYTWNFAKEYVSLPKLSEVPPFRFANKYQLPVNCLRIVRIGEFYPGLDLFNYRGQFSEEYTIQGRKILTNLDAPLPLEYIKRVEDVTLFDPCFDYAFATKLGEVLAEPLTQSGSKRDRAERAHSKALSQAIRANAIQLPPEKLADDEWLMSRI